MELITDALGSAEQLNYSGNHSLALDKLKQALQLIEQTHTESIYMADCLNALAETNFGTGEYSEASHYDLRLIALLDKTPSAEVRTKVRVLLRLGKEHKSLGYQVKAEEFFSRAVELSEKSLSADDPLYEHALECLRDLLAAAGTDPRKFKEVQGKLEGGTAEHSLAQSVPVMKPVSINKLTHADGTKLGGAEKHDLSDAGLAKSTAQLRQKETRLAVTSARLTIVAAAAIVVLILIIIGLLNSWHP